MGTSRQLLSSAGRQWLDRRRFLADAGTGLGSIALASLLGDDRLLAAQRPVIDPARPYAPMQRHLPDLCQLRCGLHGHGVEVPSQVWRLERALGLGPNADW